MIIDLHVHTGTLSPCSKIDPEEAIAEAKNIGLEAICFTEHGKLWQPKDIEFLSKKWAFPVFCGMEVETREGHMLVFGLEQDQEDIIPASELRAIADDAGAAIIYAHPFRGFLMFGFADLQLTLQNACKRPAFKMVDAMETLSGKSTRKENELALQVSQNTGVKGAGGSDAHSIGELGRCVTIFNRTISSQAELVEQLKKGNFRAEYYRK